MVFGFAQIIAPAWVTITLAALAILPPLILALAVLVRAWRCRRQGNNDDDE